MNLDNYRPCGARASQGDIVRAPIGMFSGFRDLDDLSILDQSGPALEYGDRQGIAVSIPRLRAPRATVLRAWYLPAVVVTPDCDIDKSGNQILLAPIYPTNWYDVDTQNGIRAGEYVSAFGLPAEPNMVAFDGSTFPFPYSVVELGQTTTVAPSLISRERIVTLSDSQLDRLHEAWVRFVALKELSSTGTIAAAVGKSITRVSVAESSRRRHTVVLTLDDGSVLVLYHQPR